MKNELQYYQGLLRVRLVVCRTDWPPAAPLGCSPAPDSTYTLAESLSRFILLNPSLHGQGLLTDGLRVCWEAWKKLASACITVKFKMSMRRLNHALLRWISYKVNVGRWGRERRHVQSGYSSSTVTQLVRVGLIWNTCHSKWPYFSPSALPKTWRISLSSSTTPRRLFFIRQDPCTAQRRRRWGLYCRCRYNRLSQ